jgi:hypothetical protein
MSQICKNVKKWIEEEIEEKIREEEKRRERRCRNHTRWWKRLFCWFIWVLLVFFRIFYVTIGKWVVTIVCYTISIITNSVSFLYMLVLSIPIIGKYLKHVGEYLTEFFSRTIKLFGELFWWIGKKKIRLYVLIMNGEKGMIDESWVHKHIDAMDELYRDKCNVKIILKGIKKYEKNTPKELRSVDCDLINGAFSFGKKGFITTFSLIKDFFYSNSLTATSMYKPAFAIYTALNCDGIMHNVLATNYVFIDTKTDNDYDKYTLAHEIGHLCGIIFPNLGHSDKWDPHKLNLMHSVSDATNPDITFIQKTTIRTSKYCSYL